MFQYVGGYFLNTSGRSRYILILSSPVNRVCFVDGVSYVSTAIYP